MTIINIKEILKTSDSKLLRNLPDFLLKILAKIIRQDSLNKLFRENAKYVGVIFPGKVIEYLNVNLEVKGKENLPENGKCFFVANHAFGFLDGLALAAIVGEKYDDLRIIGNDSLNLIESLSPIIADVNVFGKSPKEYILELEKLYASEKAITTFPAGIVSRVKDKKIQDIPWKKSFIKKSIENERDVVPIKFHGRNSRFFYAIYLFRQFFKIKANVELSLLPREMFRKRNKTIKVTIGKPISYKTFDKSKSHIKWAQVVREQVYKL